MESLTAALSFVLRPVLAPVSHWLLNKKRTRPTWHYEAAVVAIVLFAVAFVTSPDMGEAPYTKFLIVWLSALAVFGSFLHPKVGYRMAEALKAAGASDTSCYEWSGKYWLVKEVTWLAVFLLSGAYPAVAGALLFILYPAWRKIHTEERKRVRG